jgi:phage portal protein BeeE
MSNAIADVKTLTMSNIDMDLLNLRRFTDTKIATVF